MNCTEYIELENYCYDSETGTVSPPPCIEIRCFESAEGSGIDIGKILGIIFGLIFAILIIIALYYKIKSCLKRRMTVAVAFFLGGSLAPPQRDLEMGSEIYIAFLRFIMNL